MPVWGRGSTWEKEEWRKVIGVGVDGQGQRRCEEFGKVERRLAVATA